LMNIGMLIALGPIVALALGKTIRSALFFLAFFATCAICGGLTQSLSYVLEAKDGIAIGASSAISGLLPAVGYIRGGLKSAWSMSVPWMVINIALAFLGGDIGIMSIAWAAHLGGLAAGFTYPVFARLAAPAQ